MHASLCLLGSVQHASTCLLASLIRPPNLSLTHAHEKPKQWYAEHSTANPDPRFEPEAQIIHGNKFAQAMAKYEEGEMFRKEGHRRNKMWQEVRLSK